MPKLTQKIKSTLNALSLEVVKELVFIGDHLRAARAAHCDIADVMAEIEERTTRFKLKIKENVLSEATHANVNPLLVKLGIESLIGEHTVVPKSTLRIKSTCYKDVKIDGGSNFRDGQTNTNWAVYKSVKNAAGEIICASLYVPCAGIAYMADEHKAYVLKLSEKGAEDGSLQELKISPTLRQPFTAEYGSWHKSIYSIPKAIFTTLVRENVGGSIRESGMQQLPLIWVATGERGLCVLANVKPDSDRTGIFIGQKAGMRVSEIAITNDIQARRSIFAMHPKIAEKVLDYFNRAMNVTEGWVQPAPSKKHGYPLRKLNVVMDDNILYL